MERDDFENYFAYSLDESIDWDITLKEGKIIDESSMKLNTATNNLGEDFQLTIKTSGLMFSGGGKKSNLENDIIHFIKENENYEVDVKVIVNFKERNI